MAGMAKTKSKVERSHDGIPVPWSTAALVSVLKRHRGRKESVAALKRSGILTKDGELAKKYKSWGNKPSRTPNASETFTS
jgi:hypothetical protein